MIETRLPPQAPELERAVLGAVLVDADAMHQIADALPADAFADDKHRLIYSVCMEIFEAGQPVEMLGVVEYLRRSGKLDEAGGVLYVSQLTNLVASSRSLQHHARILAEKHLLRKTIEISRSTALSAYDQSSDPFDVIDAATRDLDGLLEGITRHQALPFAEYEARQLKDLDNPKNDIIPTGYASLDTEIGGYRIGDLHIVAGRPGMGKTAWVVGSCNGAASQGAGVGLFSMEVTEKAMQARIAALRCGIPLSNMLLSRMTTDDIALRHKGLAEAEKLPLYIRYETGMSLSEIKAETRRLKRKGVRLICIDQLNWIKSPKAGTRDAEVGAITRGLKQMAMQLEVAVVVLHQLSRSVETRGGDKKPMLSDLRDSGNVEQDAQVVMFLYRPEYYAIWDDELGSTAGVIDTIVAKNSNGALSTVRMRFDGPCAAVRDVDAPPPKFDAQAGFRKPYKDDDDQPF